MACIDEIRSYVTGRTDKTPKILLVAGAPFVNAVGDTMNFAYHARYLAAALGPTQTTIWSADGAVWRTLCGDTVSCTPFITEKEAIYGHDLVVFDRVPVDEAVEQLYSRSPAVLVELLHDGWIRFRLGRRRWKLLRVPPTVNNVRRVQQAYECLGVNTAEPPSHPNSGPNVNSQGHIYLNPYASKAEKCLDRYLLGEIIKVLVARFGHNRLTCPSSPARVVPGLRKSFSKLARVIAQASEQGVVHQLQRMTSADYITRVRSAALVIGSDTSTQHIANYYGIPSISCYPFSSGYRFYFWGCPGPRNLGFRTPGTGDKVGMKHLASLIAYVSESFISDSPGTLSARAASCDRYLQACRAVASGIMSAEEGAHQVERSLGDMRAIVPDEWANFVFPELQQLAQEVCLRAKRRHRGRRDDLSVERLKEVYALKTVRLLALADGREKMVESGRKERSALLGDP